MTELAFCRKDEGAKFEIRLLSRLLLNNNFFSLPSRLTGHPSPGIHVSFFPVTQAALPVHGLSTVLKVSRTVFALAAVSPFSAHLI